MTTPAAMCALKSQFYDKNDRPIYPGDLLKSFHFTGARKKKYWLYHVAVEIDGRLHMVPTAHLEPSKVSGGGKCPMSQRLACYAEIICGHGPGDILSFEDRPKNKGYSENYISAECKHGNHPDDCWTCGRENSRYHALTKQEGDE